MWEPDHTPNRQEFALGTEALKQLQQKLHASKKQPHKDKATIASLKQEMKLKSSWLAPIRRVPSDVLSLFFIEACGIRWKAPLILGAVCRRWREVLISTPRAWAFIHIGPDDPPFNHALIDIWLSRCGAIQCHVSLPPSASLDIAQVLCKYEKNVACLSLFENMSILDHRFSQLKELRLATHPRGGYSPRYSPTTPTTGYNSRGGYSLRGRYGYNPRGRYSTFSTSDEKELGHLNDREGRSLLDAERFPELQRLHLHGPSSTVIMHIALRSAFPSLRELHIYINDSYCVQIIKLCASSLEKLSIKLIDLDEEVEPITLPRLKQLSCSVDRSASSTTIENMPRFRTPILKSYCESQTSGDSILHSDTLTVKSFHLQSSKNVEWAKFPSLTHLTLQRDLRTILQDCEYLEDHPSVCPQLAVILWSDPSKLSNTSTESKIRNALDNRNKLTSTKIVYQAIKVQDIDEVDRCNKFQVIKLCI